MIPKFKVGEEVYVYNGACLLDYTVRIESIKIYNTFITYDLTGYAQNGIMEYNIGRTKEELLPNFLGTYLCSFCDRDKEKAKKLLQDYLLKIPNNHE